MSRSLIHHERGEGSALHDPGSKREFWRYDRRRVFPGPPRSRRTALVAALALLAAGSLGARYVTSLRPPPMLAPALVYAPLSLAAVRVATSPPLVGLSRRARPGEMVAIELTAYCLRGTTRRGRWVRPGIVAADPRIFPLSRYVEVFIGDRYEGRFLVDDTGLRIKGPILDVWKPTCAEARIFGRKKGLAVLVSR